MIDENIMNKIIAYDLTLDQAFILYCKSSGAKFLTYYRPPANEYDKLIFYEYLGINRTLTKKGVDLCKELFSEGNYDKSIDDAFEIWWQTYPSNDAHGNYSVRRLIRSGSKQKIKALYISAINKYKLSTDDMLKSLKNEIEFRKNASTKDNTLSFMQAPTKWLTEESYLLNYDSSENTSKFSEYGKSVN